jgi:ATP-dependent helicase/nuclease subunit B
VGDPVGADGSLPELLMAARSGLERLLAHFDDPSSAYIAVPRPEIAPDYGHYDHLARAGEWRDEPADLTP